MKILYAIQGTGNGHVARAEDIAPALRRKGDVDIFISGAQADIQLPYPVTFRSNGLGFYFGKNGGVDLVRTYRKNNAREFYREIREFPVRNYDLVVNDFEPVSAWAAKLSRVPCISLSHQASLLSPKVPRPEHYDPVGSWILKNYAPANHRVGFHFKSFDNDMYTPVIRSSIRQIPLGQGDHYTVYLPAYDDQKLVPLLLNFPYVKWHIFSKHTRSRYHVGRISVYPVSNESFTASMASSRGVLCGAGFETPAEALYLGKKLMVVPMKKQYEQHFNSEALKKIGVPVLKKVKKKHLGKIHEWLDSNQRVTVDYGEVADAAVNRAFGFL